MYCIQSYRTEYVLKLTTFSLKTVSILIGLMLFNFPTLWIVVVSESSNSRTFFIKWSKAFDMIRLDGGINGDADLMVALMVVQVSITVLMVVEILTVLEIHNSMVMKIFMVVKGLNKYGVNVWEYCRAFVI